MNSGTRNSWRRTPSLRPWCEPGLAVITEPPPNGKIPAPTTPGSPGGTAACQQMCSRSCSPQQEASLRLPVPFRPPAVQRHRSILAAGGRAARSLAITRSMFMRSPDRSGHLPRSLWGKVRNLGRALLEPTIRAECSTASHSSGSPGSSTVAVGPVISKELHPAMASPRGNTTGSKPGGHQGAAGEAHRTRSD